MCFVWVWVVGEFGREELLGGPGIIDDRKIGQSKCNRIMLVEGTWL